LNYSPWLRRPKPAAEILPPSLSGSRERLIHIRHAGIMNNDPRPNSSQTPHVAPPRLGAAVAARTTARRRISSATLATGILASAGTLGLVGYLGEQAVQATAAPSSSSAPATSATSGASGATSTPLVANTTPAASSSSISASSSPAQATSGGS